MAQLVAIYHTPKNAAAFDAYYASTHLPLAKSIPGLLKYEINDGPVAGPPPSQGVHLVAILHFADMAAIQTALATPEGQAAEADLENFASGGVRLLMLETKEV